MDSKSKCFLHVQQRWLLKKDRCVQTQNRWERDWGDSMAAEKRQRDVLCAVHEM
jgi:hypothetical protein